MSRHFFALMPSLRRLSALLILVSSSCLTQAQETSTSVLQPANAEHLTLADAIQRALAKNYALHTDALDVSISAAGVTEQLGIFDPKLTGSYGYSDREIPQLTDPVTGLRPIGLRNDTESYALGLNGLLPWGMSYNVGANSDNARSSTTGLRDDYDTFAGVSGRQPLLRGFGLGATTAPIRIAMTNRAISEWQYRQSLIDTVTRVVSAYYELNFAYANLRSSLRARELAAGLVAENEKRHRVGSMSEFDVTTAQSRLANREEAILVAERSVRVAENNLKALISDNRTPTLLDWRLAIDPVPPPPVPLVNPALDFVEALQKRPDYQQARLALKRGEINHRYQRNQLLPRVDLTGSYGYSGRDRDESVARRMVRDEDYRSYSYGLEVTVPLSFTAERGRYRSAKLALRQAENELQRLEQDIVIAVGNAASQIETTRRRVAAAQAARELGQQTLDAELKRLRAGTGNTFFVLQQQEILASLEVSEARARSDYMRALADYDRQLGITLEKLNISVVVPK